MLGRFVHHVIESSSKQMIKERKKILTYWEEGEKGMNKCYLQQPSPDVELNIFNQID
jgi:hypothetical protein